jgi:hypothetical protein
MINTSASERTRQLRLLRGLSSAGEKVGSYKSVYSPGLTLAALPKFFTKLDAGTRRVNNEDYGQNPIYLNMPQVNPIVPTGDYNVFTFTPTVSGWYRIIVDNFGEGGPGSNDIDLAIGNGNTPLDIPFLVNYDLNENYDTPPETDYKVFSFTGTNSDEITSYFIAGQAYQVLAIGYNGDGGGTYTLTVRDNTLLEGAENTITSTFFYTGAYQLYQFTATQTSVYDFSLEFSSDGPGSNRSDIFISTADTAIDIQGCIDYDNEEGPLPESVLEYSNAEGGKNVFPELVEGSVYQVLVYQYYTNNVFRKYDLQVNIPPPP